MSLNSVSEDIRLLLGNGAKGVVGTDLFSFQWGSSIGGGEVDKQIVVKDSGAIEAKVKDEYENPTFNILVRGETSEGFKSVHDRARDIYEFVIVQIRQTLNGTEYVEFAPIGGLMSLGKDSNNRVVYSMNFFTYRNSI